LIEFSLILELKTRSRHSLYTMHVLLI